MRVAISNLVNSRSASLEQARLFVLAVIAALVISAPIPPLSGTAQAKTRLLRFDGRVILPPHTYSPKKRLVILLHGVDTPYSGRKWAGPDGRFRFSNLVPGIYSLAIYIPEDRQIVQTLDLTPSLADAKGRIQRNFVYDERTLESHLMNEPQSIVSARQLSIPAKARAEYMKALRRLERRDVDRAVEHLKRAVESAPQFVEALNHLGTIAFQRSDYAAAERHFRQALEQDPESYEPLVNLGGALLAQGRSREALAINLHAQNARPRDALANAQLGLSYFAVGDYEQAIGYLRATEELDPGHFSNPQITLAEIYIRRSDTDAARRELQAFLRLHPDSPHAAGVRAAVERIESGNTQSGPVIPPRAPL
ncbi:MAG: tetratricopeptide repeat protein [Acidobacteria bacterium]|nr:tetratricopeptide repeat protein [Acidobacteriota bacterium]